jgi:hypothetical protein
MGKNFREKLAVFIVFSLFLIEAVFGGYAIFQKTFSNSENKVEISLLSNDPEVKGISFSTYDNLLNFSYAFMIVSINILAIIFVTNFVFKESKHKR